MTLVTPLDDAPARPPSAGTGFTRRHLALAAVILAGTAVYAQSLDVGLYHDDYILLEGMAAAPSLGRWVLAPHNEHLMTIPKLLYVAFHGLAGTSALPWHILILAVHAATAAGLAVLLRKAGLSAVAQVFGAGAFAVSMVYHETIFWVAASNATLCLFFAVAGTLALARFRERGRPVWFAIAVALVVGALLCWSTAFALVVILPAVGLALEPDRENRRRAVLAYAAAPLLAAVAVFAGARALGADQASRSAVLLFEPIAGSWLGARSIVERLAARFFTGGTLPRPAALAVLVLVSGAALLRGDGGGARPRSRRIAVLAPVVWILASTWIIYPFRTILGEVAFLARYELFPAFGFAWLAALATDGVMGAAAGRSARLRRAAVAGILGLALPAIFAMQGYASWVCHGRWIARTEPLRIAHLEIARGLPLLIDRARSEGRGTVVLRDFAIGGGIGLRPRLASAVRYLLPAEATRVLRFPADPLVPLDPAFVALVQDLRRGRTSWVEWLDDLAVEVASAGSAAPRDAMPVERLFPLAEGARWEPCAGGIRVHLIPYAQESRLVSARRTDLGNWQALRFRVRATRAAEMLVAFTGPDLPFIGRGARIAIPAERDVVVSVDVALAARGAIALADRVELRFLTGDASYELTDMEVVTGAAEHDRAVGEPRPW